MGPSCVTLTFDHSTLELVHMLLVLRSTFLLILDFMLLFVLELLAILRQVILWPRDRDLLTSKVVHGLHVTQTTFLLFCSFWTIPFSS